MWLSNHLEKHGWFHFWHFGGKEAGREERMGSGGKQGGEKIDYQRFKKTPTIQYGTFYSPMSISRKDSNSFWKPEFLSTKSAWNVFFLSSIHSPTEKFLISSWRTEGRLPQSLLAFSTLDLDKGDGTTPALQKNGHQYAPGQDEQYLERQATD